MYKLSSAAVLDIDEILEYSIVEFGIDVATHYYQSLENTLTALGENPLMGRSADDLLEGYHRFEYESHIIFFTVTNSDILVQRILHKSRDIPRLIE